MQSGQPIFSLSPEFMLSSLLQPVAMPMGIYPFVIDIENCMSNSSTLSAFLIY